MVELYQIFLCTSRVDVPRSSDGVAIRYILLILWMTSCLHTMGQNQARRCLEESPGGGTSHGLQTSTAYGQVCQNASLDWGRSLLSTIALSYTMFYTDVSEQGRSQDFSLGGV